MGTALTDCVAPPQPVSGMLGHFSAGFTLDTYAHVTTASQRQAAKTMGSILSGSL